MLLVLVAALIAVLVCRNLLRSIIVVRFRLVIPGAKQYNRVRRSRRAHQLIQPSAELASHVSWRIRVSGNFR